MKVWKFYLLGDWKLSAINGKDLTFTVQDLIDYSHITGEGYEIIQIGPDCWHMSKNVFHSIYKIFEEDEK